jgi:hypothetical protein
MSEAHGAHGGHGAESHSHDTGGLSHLVAETAKIIGAKGQAENAADTVEKLGAGGEAALGIVGDIAAPFLGPILSGENPIAGGGGGSHGGDHHGGGGHSH